MYNRYKYEIRGKKNFIEAFSVIPAGGFELRREGRCGGVTNSGI